jgi:hypothetical protein
MDENTGGLSYYKPSGTAPAAGTLFTLAAGLVWGAALGAVYAIANRCDPFPLANVLLVFAAGLLLGSPVAFCVVKFRVRSPRIVLMISFLAFASFYASHWVFYVASVLAKSAFDFDGINADARVLSREPSAVFDAILKLNESGWTVTGAMGDEDAYIVKGKILAGLWAAEAGIIFFNALKPPFAASRKPFSERLGKWITPRVLPGRVAFVESKKVLKSRLAKGDFGALTTPVALRDGRDTEEKYAVVELFPDPEAPCMCVRNVSTRVRKNKKEARSVYVLKNLRISTETAQEISGALS